MRAPIGARIGVLPRGYVKVRLGPLTYFHHYGTYYRYDPVKKVYIVVEKPAEVEEELVLDRVTMVDGTTIDGIYMGGTQSTIQFEVDGEIEEIEVEEIASIKFVEVDNSKD